MSPKVMGNINSTDKIKSFETFTIEPIQNQINCFSFKSSPDNYLSCITNHILKFNSEMIGKNDNFFQVR
jgi:hypothetical protein